MRIQITQNERDLARKVAQWRVEAKDKKIRYNSAGYHANPDIAYPHYVGLLGEIAFSKAWDVEVDLSALPGGDHIDFGAVEVKTRLNKGDIMVKCRDWDRKVPKYYVLIWLSKDETYAEVAGVISREDFDKKKRVVTLFNESKYTVASSELTVV